MTQQQNPAGIGHLRCSDEDRELVAQVLNNAYADGRLDFEEHSERITAAYNAKLFKDLDPLILDLIPTASQAAAGTQPQAAAPGQPTTHAGTHSEAFTRPATVDELGSGQAILSTLRRGPGITMPERSNLSAIMGEIRLDLSEARFTSRETVIHLTAIMGVLRIRLPAGVRVVNRVGEVLAESKVRGIVPDNEVSVLVLEGTSWLSQIRILGPDVKKRHYEKFL